MGSGSKVGNSNYDYSFKILLTGDSGVGKSSLLLSFISNSNSLYDLSPTIGSFLFFLVFFFFASLFLFSIVTFRAFREFEFVDWENIY